MSRIRAAPPSPSARGGVFAIRARRARGGPAHGAAAAPLGQTLEFMRLLWAVDHAFTRTSKRMERELGVTALQHLVARLVARQPGVSAGALARTLHVHPSTLTGVLRRLARRGALVRSADPSDGRRALFALTRRGHALARLEAGTPEARVEGAIASLPQGDLAAAERVLTRLAAALSEA